LTERKTWTVTDVTDVFGPSAILRSYLEHRDVRRYLQRAAARTPIACAVDVGCGYGRLTPVLTECASRVIGCEREASLLEIARPLQPDITFVECPTLTTLPLPDASAEFVMAFTVLQHMADAHAEAVLAEIRRVATPRAHVLLVEETDITLEAGDASQADLGYTRGRPVSWYADRLPGFTLVETSPRRIEPGYPRPDVGTYMFFARD
jgi:ubiquinone/menaquinone biosynthesis C-methylase UbiE